MVIHTDHHEANCISQVFGGNDCLDYGVSGLNKGSAADSEESFEAADVVGGGVVVDSRWLIVSRIFNVWV